MKALAADSPDLSSELKRLQLATHPSSLANPLGPVMASGILRSSPSDFRVTELPLEFPSMGGEHFWLRIRKTGQNTAWVAKQLAGYAGVDLKNVSYAGLKDRNAITEQWFSVLIPGRNNPNWSELRLPGVEVLDSIRRIKKLRRGQLLGNQFQLRIRALKGNLNEFCLRLSEVAEFGVPNYFGEQRFGHSGDNLRLLSGDCRLDRDKRSMAYSALRSALFNIYLNNRVQDSSWDFCSRVSGADDVRLSDRDGGLKEYIAFSETAADNRPTGVLWGMGQGRITAAEEAFFKTFPAVTALLEKEGLRRHRRSLWLPVRSLEWDLVKESDGVILNLSFCLPPGSFATTVLDMLLGFRLNNSI